jgi:hypothetical protein
MKPNTATVVIFTKVFQILRRVPRHTANIPRISLMSAEALSSVKPSSMRTALAPRLAARSSIASNSSGVNVIWVIPYANHTVKSSTES